MTDLSYAESVVACPPDTRYDMLAEVTRMGEWSPIGIRSIVGHQEIPATLAAIKKAAEAAGAPVSVARRPGCALAGGGPARRRR
jgi:hypothetical protein